MADNREEYELATVSEYTEYELQEAYRALLSTLHKCEKMDMAKLGASQRTLLERRIAALKIALALIEKELTIKNMDKGGQA